ncbi:MAG: GerAB/ArcD/ProY family transporter [Clostridia bacterium]
MTNNIVYKKQICLLAFVLTITFKVAMLPKYLFIEAQNQIVLLIVLYMLLEFGIFALIYCSIQNQNIVDIFTNKWVKIPLFSLLGVAYFCKFLVFFCEALNFISLQFFDDQKWEYLSLAFLPIIVYIAFKGGNCIVRLTELSVWIVALAILFNFIYLRVDMDATNILPILPNGIAPLASAFDKNLIWFFDYTPLLFLTVKSKKNESKWFVPVAIFIIALMLVGYYFLLIAAFGNGMYLINNSFTKIAIFNKFSELFGVIDLPMIATWMIMATINLATIFFGCLQCLTEVTKCKKASASIMVLLVELIIFLKFSNLQVVYEFATSWVRYLILAVGVGVPILVFCVAKIKQKNNNKSKLLNDNKA